MLESISKCKKNCWNLAINNWLTSKHFVKVNGCRIVISNMNDKVRNYLAKWAYTYSFCTKFQFLGPCFTCTFLWLLKNFLNELRKSLLYINKKYVLFNHVTSQRPSSFRFRYRRPPETEMKQLSQRTIPLPPVWHKEPTPRLQPLGNDEIAAAHKVHGKCGTWHHGTSSP